MQSVSLTEEYSRKFDKMRKRKNNKIINKIIGQKYSNVNCYVFILMVYERERFVNYPVYSNYIG